MSSKKKEFTITPVSELPKAIKARITVYDEILEDIQKRSKGLYEINVPGKKTKSMYSSISKRIKDEKLPMKLHLRGERLIIEKL